MPGSFFFGRGNLVGSSFLVLALPGRDLTHGELGLSAQGLDKLGGPVSLASLAALALARFLVLRESRLPPFVLRSFWALPGGVWTGLRSAAPPAGLERMSSGTPEISGNP